MTIKLNKPYKISAHKAMQYQRHYGFQAHDALIVPQRVWDDQASCDVLWENEHGILQFKKNKMFTGENLVPLDELFDEHLHQVWLHYYVAKNKRTLAIVESPGF